jgi:hypothetical protein
VRAHKPAQVNTDTERIAIQMKRGAPAKVEFEIDVPALVIDASIETIIAHKVCGTLGYAGSAITFAVCGRAARIAFGGGSAPENPADHRLIPPRCDVISGSREAEIARIVFETTVELGVVSEGNEGAPKISSVHDGIADPGVEERREVSEGVVDMVRQIPGCMTRTEALLRVAGRGRQVNGRTVIQEFVGIVLAIICFGVSYAVARERLRSPDHLHTLCRETNNEFFGDQLPDVDLLVVNCPTLILSAAGGA